MGHFGTEQPGVLYPHGGDLQLCNKEAPLEEEEVEKKGGKTSVSVQATHSSCIEIESGRGLRGARVDRWKAYYKLHSCTGEETHVNSSAYR